MVSIPGDLGQNMKMDPKMVQEIVSSPAMSSEQGSGFLSQYGGPNQYIEMARVPEEARITFYAVQAGASSPDEIEVMTGLSKNKINSGIGFLEKRGLVTRTEVTPDSGV
jgi:hypothetical protein